MPYLTNPRALLTGSAPIPGGLQPPTPEIPTLPSTADISTYFRQELVPLLGGLIAAAVILLITLYFAGFLGSAVTRALKARRTSPQTVALAARITRYIIFILGLFVALEQVGFNLTAFLTGLGIVGFTVGFALQDVSKNFVSGMILLIQQPFSVGEAIKVTDYSGSVVTIDLRATEIRTFDGQVVLIPNATFLTNPITNYTRARNRRVEFSLNVDAGVDLEAARQAALGALSAIPGLVQPPAPEVLFQGLTYGNAIMLVRYWIATGQIDLENARDHGLLAVKAALEAGSVRIGY